MEATASTLVARASFLMNMFHGNSILSAFQLARGYAPSILGITSSVVNAELLEAHIETVATRAIQKAMKYRNNNVIPSNKFNEGDRVWIFYKTSKQNERTRWVEARVISAEQHGLKCRRAAKGPPMMVAYEHVRMAPKGKLAEDLLNKSLEDELYTESYTSSDEEFASDENHEDGNSGNESTVKKEPKIDVEGEIMEQENNLGTAVADDAPPSHLESLKLMRDIFGDEGSENLCTGEKTSLVSAVTMGRPEKDIGRIPKNAPEVGEELNLDEQHVLEQVFSVAGSGQVTRKKWNAHRNG